MLQSIHSLNQQIGDYGGDSEVWKQAIWYDQHVKYDAVL